MDGIIVFSKHDDVIFIHSNDIFEEHIYKKAKENGLTDVRKCFILFRVTITAKIRQLKICFSHNVVVLKLVLGAEANGNRRERSSATVFSYSDVTESYDREASQCVSFDHMPERNQFGIFSGEQLGPRCLWNLSACKYKTNYLISFSFQHQNDIYIAVTDMKEYSLDFVRRKLLIVQHMLNFLFGPVHTE